MKEYHPYCARRDELFDANTKGYLTDKELVEELLEAKRLIKPEDNLKSLMLVRSPGIEDDKPIDC